MGINKSILENFELTDGTEVYIQSSGKNDVRISFDGKNQSFMQCLTIVQAKALSNRINIVIKEMLEVQNGKA